VYEVFTDYTKYRSAGAMLTRALMPGLEDGMPAWQISHISINYWIQLISNPETRAAGFFFTALIIFAIIYTGKKIYSSGIFKPE
jgi:dolichyl-phosphate-mannose--protein O-mannosyl transferase